MPTELEELVEFLHHGNTQIRQVAAENLVEYTQTQPSLFKRNQLEPMKDLKLLARDYDPIRKNALTMLINLSGDNEMREFLAKDDEFLETLLSKITKKAEPLADLISMLLANLSKSDSLTRLFTLQRPAAPDLAPSTSKTAMDQLLDVFVRSRSGWNTAGQTCDYLAYVVADLSKHDAGSRYLTRPPQSSADGVIPLAKLLPFTAVEMPVARRLGVASAIKNVAMAAALLPPASDAKEDGKVNGEGDATRRDLVADLDLLRYLLLPLADGRDAYTDDEQELMLDDLQLLDEETVRRDADPRVLAAHLDTLLVLSSSRPGREQLRTAGTYYVVRECHLAVQHDDVKEACERLVQVLQRGEPEGEEQAEGDEESKVLGEVEDDGDDDKVVDIV